MNGTTFVRQRARIERRHTKEATRRKALDHLVREAAALTVMVDGKVVAHRLPCGFIACTLRRYRTEEAAYFEIDDAARFQGVNKSRRVPIRAYLCHHCQGYHTTAAPLADNDNDDNCLHR